jgi:hypothetical protein
MNTEVPGALPVVALAIVVSDYHCLKKLKDACHPWGRMPKKNASREGTTSTTLPSSDLDRSWFSPGDQTMRDGGKSMLLNNATKGGMTHEGTVVVGRTKVGSGFRPERHDHASRQLQR